MADVQTISVGSLTTSSAKWLRSEGQSLLRSTARRELAQGIQLRGGRADFTLAVDGRSSRTINTAERKIEIVDVGETLNVRQLLGAVTAATYDLVRRITGRLGLELSVDVFRRRTRRVERVAPALPVRLGGGDVLRVVWLARYAAFVSRNVAKAAIRRSAITGRSRRFNPDATGTVRVSAADIKARSLTTRVARRLRPAPFLRGFTIKATYLRGPPGQIALNIKRAFVRRFTGRLN